jgi:hypothetical protein
LRLVVALATILSLFIPAATSFAAATISLSPATGAALSSTTISGGGFAANTTVRIFFDGSSGPQVGIESSDGAGGLPGLAFTVPAVGVGLHQVFATDGTNSATTNFNVVSLTLTPASGGPGTVITVTGSGFQPNEAVSIAWDQTSSQVTTATANISGQIFTSFSAPNGTGNHQVIATGQSSGFVLKATFSLGGASLTLNPTSGAAGSDVHLSGTGFNANEQVNLAVDGNGLTSVNSDGSGNFSTTVTLSSSLGSGDHTISATGATSGHSASAVFDVNNGRRGHGEDEDDKRGPVTCTSENSRPGHGWGDRNHCHTGPPGNDDDQGEDD